MTGDIPRWPAPLFNVGTLKAALSQFPDELPVLLEGDGNQIIGLDRKGDRVTVRTNYVSRMGLGSRDG